MKPASIGLSAFAPGKVILLGEHGVVYGHPALAAPISRGVRAFGAPAKATQLELPPGLSKRHRQTLELAFSRAAEKAGFPAISVHVESDLPVSMGLGSSGALSVAVAKVLLEAQRRGPVLVRDVETLAMEMERAFHGTPSGVDHTTSARGTMLLYQRGKAKVVKARRPVKVLIVLVGERASTQVTVGGLRQRLSRWPRRYRRLFAEIGRLVGEGVHAVARGDLEALGDLMNVNHGLLGALGLSSDCLESMVYRLRDLGALGAKLTGAGGDGGAVLGLFAEPEHALVRLRAQGFECFVSQLAGPVAL